MQLKLPGVLKHRPLRHLPSLHSSISVIVTQVTGGINLVYSDQFKVLNSKNFFFF